MRLSVVLLIALAGAHVTAAAQSSRPDDQAELRKLREELQLNEEKIEILRRVTPPEFDRNEEEKSLRKLAAAAKLSNLKIRFLEETARLPLEDGTPSPMEMHRLELSGRAPFQDFHLFLSMLEHRPRFARVETLRLDAAEASTVRFSARIVVPVMTADPQPEPPLREGMLAATRHRVARNRAIVWAVSQYLDPARREHVPDALAMLEGEIGTRPIALINTNADGNGVTLRGVVVGAAARAVLKSALENAGLSTIKEAFTRDGICQSFTITARPKPGDLPPQAVVGNGLFDAGTGSVCKPELAPAGGQIVAGSSSADSPPPFLQLRDVDLADVFAALGDLLPEGFVVDQDVTGRVRVDVFDNASLDDVFQATAVATGISIGSGPVRLVSRATRAHSSNTTENPGAPVSFTFKEVAIADVLCVFREITGTEILAPPDQRGRLSIFAIETPTNHLLGAVTDAAGLTSSRDGPRLILRKRGDTPNVVGVNVCEIRTPASSSQRLDLLPASLHELGLADIELIGLARLSENWRGYIYGPARRLMPLEAGFELFDATVKSVGPEGVTLARRDGKVVTMALPD